MEATHEDKSLVLVIGAGPAGLFTADELAKQGHHVILLNRDIRPGGLAEYGIYFAKHQVKASLRNQFLRVLRSPNVTYYGNVEVGQGKDLSLDALRAMGFGAIVVAVGAQGTKWLGLPGEHLRGVYHAKDLIYYYNGLPPYSERTYTIGQRVALIGVGNVMADIARWLARDLKVAEVVAVARRGPAEVKFSPRELAYVGRNLDLAALDEEIERVRSRMLAVGQDPEAAKAHILSALRHSPEPVSDTRITFRFLSAPVEILDDGSGAVGGLRVEDTALTLEEGGRTRPKRLGTYHILPVDTVIFCIGDRVSEDFGLPVAWSSFVKHPHPRYPVDGVSFEAYDPETGAPIEGVFLVGWAREASKGQVGLARKDARMCSRAVVAYLEDAGRDASGATEAREALKMALSRLDKPVIPKQDVFRLVEIEARKAKDCDEPGFRYTSNREMLEALGIC